MSKNNKGNSNAGQKGNDSKKYHNGYQPTTGITTQPPNTGSSVQPAKTRDK